MYGYNFVASVSFTDKNLFELANELDTIALDYPNAVCRPDYGTDGYIDIWVKKSRKKREKKDGENPLA